MTTFFIDVFLAPVRDNTIVQAGLIGLLVLMALDFFFGILQACLDGNYQSRKMHEGLGHKVVELGYILVGVIADGLIFAGLDLGISGPILGFIVTYLCVMEIGSLLEIFSKINPEIADSPVGRILASIKDNNGKHVREDS